VGLITTFYYLRFETPPTWRARSPYLYPPGTEWLSYNLRRWVPFLSPPTASRATVEVFEPTSTQGPDYIITSQHRQHGKHCSSVSVWFSHVRNLLLNSGRCFTESTCYNNIVENQNGVIHQPYTLKCSALMCLKAKLTLSILNVSLGCFESKILNSRQEADRT
jgi:hypothetical protein